MPLQSNISSLIPNDFEKERKNYPNCLCGNQINTKILKMDSNILYYGICTKCDRLNFYKEFTELKHCKYQQTWQKISNSEMKKDFEEYLFITISDENLEYYSASFEEIISKTQVLSEIKQLIKIGFKKQS